MSSTPRFTSVTGKHWPGFLDVKKMFIFGDSYSSVGYDTGWPAPTQDEPLGVPFPGYTWTEGGEEDMGDSTNPNWVGHLVMGRLRDLKPLLVYDYAVGGHDVAGVKSQIDLWFLPNVGKRPQWAPWNSDDSLFVTWVGINDCAHSDDHERDIAKLFELQEVLYINGARNFLLIDVPPIFKSPAVPSSFESDPRVRDTYFNWNDNLHKGAEKFQAEHSDITTLMYSSWDIFDKVYRNPEAHGFALADLKRPGGPMWMDRLHPSSKFHLVLARDLESFLKGFPASKHDVAEEE